MKTITSGHNTKSTLTIRSVTFHEALQRVEIVYRLSLSTIDPAEALSNKDHTLMLRNKPAQKDENGVVLVEAVNDLTDFLATVSSHQAMTTQALELATQDAVKKGLFLPYLDDTAETWANHPIHDHEPAPEWTTGERVMAGMVRTHAGVKARALKTHTTSYELEPGKCDVWGGPDVYRDGFWKRLKNLF